MVERGEEKGERIENKYSNITSLQSLAVKQSYPREPSKSKKASEKQREMSH